jgi:succinoglycan biosynthesis transport protein ExoP
MEPHTTEMTLRDYGGVVRRRRWVVVAAVLLCTMTSVLLVALQTPIYSASSQVLVQPRGQDGLFESQVVNLNDRAIQTEIQVIEGQSVRDRVQRDLGMETAPPTVNASAVEQTDVISLSVRDSNASNAATYANAYAEAYIDVRREQSINELLAASTEVQIAIDDLQIRIDLLDEDDARRPPLVAQLATLR